MKQACCRRRADGVRGVLLVLAVLVLTLVFASCAKQRAQEPAPETTETNAGFNITTQPAQTIPGRAVQKSMGVECQNNLRQLRMMMDTGRGAREDGMPPSSLNEVVSDPNLLNCPISRQPYSYDSTTGEVHCTFPGHENF